MTYAEPWMRLRLGSFRNPAMSDHPHTVAGLIEKRREIERLQREPDWGGLCLARLANMMKYARSRPSGASRLEGEARLAAPRARGPEGRYRRGPCRCSCRAGEGRRRCEHRPAREEAINRPLALRLTETAEGDLAEIWAYVAAEASEVIATLLLATIEAAFTQAQHFPLAGIAPDQLRPGLAPTSKATTLSTTR